MKRLILLRHAKTETDNKGGDHARVLTERGRSDAALIGRCLEESGYHVDLVLCSTSARTRQTWDIVAPLLSGKPRIEFLDPLYLAPVKRIVSIVDGVPDATGTVVVIGHNPGMEEAAALLARKPETSEERANLKNMREKFSTGAFAVLDFDTDHWKEAAPHLGAVTAFVRPKFLRAE
ncbi:MAG: histidine phosphatase family protein [Proteobacteria bacterium]|nr:histidine phosphatase family protein [Pseudomonadota bacterium]